MTISKWEKNRKAAIKAFKPITVSYTTSYCPDCFGSLPQSNESAWAKGCKECPLYIHSDACQKATQKVNDASMSKKEWNDMAKRFKEYMSESAWNERFGNSQPKFS